MGFEFHVHGLWILGSIAFLIGTLMAGNLQWVEGTTQASFIISVVITFLFILFAGALWISAAVNARHEQR
ncbi:MAG TPA: hypothetical protein VJI12_04700 [archaeon]|nr:hypothetical protein [archaeon]